MVVPELILWILGVIGSFLLLLVSFMINKLNRSIEKLEEQVAELKIYVSAQNIINRQTEKMADVLAKIEQHLYEYEAKFSKLEKEHNMYYHRKDE